MPALGVTAPAGTMVTVSGNTAALSKTGYDFAGWNTQADGSGFPYQEGTSLIVPYGQAVTLYAQWRAKSYVVEFDTQGGTSSETSRTITFDQAYGTLPVPTKEGFRFLGWHTSTDESFARKVSSETIHREPGHIVLFAWWDDFIDAPYVVNHYFQDIATDSYELGLTRVLYATIGSEVQAELRRFEHFTGKKIIPAMWPAGWCPKQGISSYTCFMTVTAIRLPSPRGWRCLHHGALWTPSRQIGYTGWLPVRRVVDWCWKNRHAIDQRCSYCRHHDRSCSLVAQSLCGDIQHGRWLGWRCNGQCGLWRCHAGSTTAGQARLCLRWLL